MSSPGNQPQSSPNPDALITSSGSQASSPTVSGVMTTASGSTSTSPVSGTLAMATGLIKCPLYCRHNCIRQHHPLLVAILNCVDTEHIELMEMKLGILYSVINKYKQSGRWQPNDPIPDVLDEFQVPMLHWVCTLGRVGAAVWLVGHNISDPVIKSQLHDGETALHRALKCLPETCPVDASRKFVQLLSVMSPALDVLDDYGNSPLHLCCEMLRIGMRCSGYYRECLHYMLYELNRDKQHSDKLPRILNIQNKDGDTLLHLLAENNSFLLEEIKPLVQLGADYTLENTKGLTPYEIAVKKNCEPIAQFLETWEGSEPQPLSFLISGTIKPHDNIEFEICRVDETNTSDSMVSLLNPPTMSESTSVPAAAGSEQAGEIAMETAEGHHSDTSARGDVETGEVAMEINAKDDRLHSTTQGITTDGSNSPNSIEMLESHISTPQSGLATPPDTGTPLPDIATPLPDIATPQPDIATPQPDIATPKLDASAPSSDLAAPSSDLAAPSSDLAAPSSDLAAPSSDLTAPSPDISIAQPDVPAAQPLDTVDPQESPATPATPATPPRPSTPPTPVYFPDDPELQEHLTNTIQKQPNTKSGAKLGGKSNSSKVDWNYGAFIQNVLNLNIPESERTPDTKEQIVSMLNEMAPPTIALYLATMRETGMQYDPLIDFILEDRNETLKQLKKSSQCVEGLKEMLQNEQQKQDSLVSEIMTTFDHIGKLTQEEDDMVKEVSEVSSEADIAQAATDKLQERLDNTEAALLILKELYHEALSEAAT